MVAKVRVGTYHLKVDKGVQCTNTVYHGPQIQGRYLPLEGGQWFASSLAVEGDIFSLLHCDVFERSQEARPQELQLHLLQFFFNCKVAKNK